MIAFHSWLAIQNPGLWLGGMPKLICDFCADPLTSLNGHCSFTRASRLLSLYLAGQGFLGKSRPRNVHDTRTLMADSQHQQASGGLISSRSFPQDSAGLPDSNYSQDVVFSVEAKEHDNATTGVPAREIHGWKWVLVITAILSSIFLYALDATIVADIQPFIIQEFGGIEKLSWLSVAFLASASATNMVWGRIYGHFNVKWFYLFNVLLFELGSALCGAAPNLDALIVGRAICGVGGAGLYVGVMSLLAMTTTIKERPVYNSMTGFTWGLGIVLGPVIGGGFAESAVGWRWGFYINLFIGGVCTPAWIFLLPNKDPQPGASYRDRCREMDYLGVLILMAAIILFSFAINWGGVTYPWVSGPVLGLFIGSALLFLCLGAQQTWSIWTTVQRRIIPVQFFRSRSVLVHFATTASSGAAAFVPIYFVPLFFVFTRGDGALEAGVRLLPFIAVMVVMVFTNGALMSRLGYYIPWYTAGGMFTVIGAALMYTVDRDTSEARIYGYTTLIGLGVGMYLQASFSVVQALVEPEDVPPAVGFLTLAQFAGITIALAIANALYLNESQDKVAAMLPDYTSDDIALIIQGTSGGLLDNLDTETKKAVLELLVSAMSKTYMLVVVAGSLVTVLSVFMKRQKLFLEAGVTGS